jgi:hypothetical protein
MIDNQRVTKQDLERAQQAARRSLLVWIGCWVLFFGGRAYDNSACLGVTILVGIPILFIAYSNMNAHNHILARYQRQLDIKDAIRASLGEQPDGRSER